MPLVKLRYNDRELTIGEGITPIGRSSDNAISFAGDSNVSRYHAEIESRGEEFCLIDLSSSNGTTVNGTKVEGETFLKPGDVIVLGGTSKIVFGEPAAAAAEPERSGPQGSGVDGLSGVPAGATAADAASLGSALEANAAGGPNKMLIAAGAICLIALLFVAAAAAVFYFTSVSSCDATAGFVSPDQGENITVPTDIEISVKNEACVARAIYTIDGKPFATADAPPFGASIDPKNFPELADGVDHLLGVILIDSEGNQLPQAGGVMVALETRRITAPEKDPETVVTGPQPPPGGTKGPSLIDIQQMSNALAARFAGGRQYNVSNQQFLNEVQKKTAEYAQGGFFAKASKYRDAINVAYAREQNLDAALGYILAMSRSRFDPVKQGGGEGLWKMTSEFAGANGYNGQCGTETLADPSQTCAAKASALYMKTLVFSVFDGDMIYSAAAFGRSPAEAGTWKSSLPANRTDVWNSIKTAPEREQLVRFFAAGIVAENPQKFGLNNDRPLSELYRLTM
jgi:hypothetical protein